MAGVPTPNPASWHPAPVRAASKTRGRPPPDAGPLGRPPSPRPPPNPGLSGTHHGPTPASPGSVAGTATPRTAPQWPGDRAARNSVGGSPNPEPRSRNYPTTQHGGSLDPPARATLHRAPPARWHPRTAGPHPAGLRGPLLVAPGSPRQEGERPQRPRTPGAAGRDHGPRPRPCAARGWLLSLTAPYVPAAPGSPQWGAGSS